MEELSFLKDARRIVFKRRSVSVSPELRYFKKLSTLILTLKLVSIKNQATILKIQFFNWALASNENKSEALELLKKEKDLFSGIIYLDPAINRMIDYAISEKYVIVDKKGRIKLAPKGEIFCEFLLDDRELLSEEKKYLYHLGKKMVTDDKVKSIIEGTK